MQGKIAKYAIDRVLGGDWDRIKPGPILFRVDRVDRGDALEEGKVVLSLEFYDTQGNLLQSWDGLEAQEGDTIRLASMFNKKINLVATDDGFLMDLIDEG